MPKRELGQISAEFVGEHRVRALPPCAVVSSGLVRADGNLRAAKGGADEERGAGSASSFSGGERARGNVDDLVVAPFDAVDAGGVRGAGDFYGGAGGRGAGPGGPWR